MLEREYVQAYQYQHRTSDQSHALPTEDESANLRLGELEDQVKQLSRNNAKLRRSNELIKLEAWHSEELKQKICILENKIIDLNAEINRSNNLVGSRN